MEKHRKQLALKDTKIYLFQMKNKILNYTVLKYTIFISNRQFNFSELKIPKIFLIVLKMVK